MQLRKLSAKISVFLWFICNFSTAWADFSEVQLSVWVNEAIVATYTYDYQNFLEQQQKIAKYFTANAWIAYSKALNDAKVPDNIEQNAYHVSAVATLPPTIHANTPGEWEAVMPVLVVYANPQYQQKQTLEVKINFKMAPSGQGIRGLTITGFKANVVKPACKCPL